MIDKRSLIPAQDSLGGISTKETGLLSEAPAREALTSDPRQVAKRSMRKEVGGCDGPEPTRFGDWQHNGRCTDF